jgi:signal transduction histidine kinase
MSLAKKYQPTVETTPEVAPNLRILVVDDEVSIAEGIESILCPDLSNVIPLRRSSRSPNAQVSNTGLSPIYQVTVAHTPTEALQLISEAKAKGEPFAMGFFDVLLNAEIDGIELVRQAFEIDPDLFATFVTAYQDRSVNSINQLLGEERSERWDYINKPFSEGEILQKARNVTSLWNLKRDKLLNDEKLAEAHRMLLQSERASTVAAIGRSVAHEFGNVLMHIVGNAELALLKNEHERMRTALETILKASDTASHVLSRFKNLANGPVSESPEFVLVNLAQIMNESIDLMNHQFKKLNVEIVKTQVDQVLIEAHPQSLVQVVVNVLINSCYVMPKGGEIEISVVKLTDNEVQIQVRDSGPGIPSEVLPRVTEAMFTTKGSEGSGLGLSICREIIEIEHQGRFAVSNHVGGGALVTITLPTRQETP